MSKALPHIVLVLSLTLVLLGLAGCAQSANNPAGSANHVWNVSGRTYFVGSTASVGAVVLTCAGMTVTTGSDGTYGFRDVPEGNQTLTARRPDCDPYSQSLDVNSDMTCYVYLNPHSMRLWGHITNAVNGPVQGAKVTLGGLVLYTDTSGQYQFANILRGTYTLSVTHPTYLPYQATLFLVSDSLSDVVLNGELSLEGTIKQDTYVDQTNASDIYWTSTALLLSQRAYDSTEHNYVSAIRNIYISFSFPEILTDKRFSIVDAALQLFRYDRGPTINFNTFAVVSAWDQSSISYNRQPAQGDSLYGGSIAGFGNCIVLATDGVNRLLSDWRANRPFRGIVINGGDTTLARFGSYESTLKPKLTLTVRY
jgi:hypothetical protein